MFFKTFKGGIHPKYNKDLTAGKAIEKAKDPQTVSILLVQHSGAPCLPTVNVGDHVKVGQKIGDTDKFVSSPVHSSVSGKVVKIDQQLCFTGSMIQAVYIESDGKNELFEGIKPYPSNLTGEEILKAIREMGIVGMGGAAFPTHVKLSPPKDAKIDAILINGAECEPFLTCDHRIMLEEGDNIASGIELIKRIVGVKKALVVVEDNKKDAIKNLKRYSDIFTVVEVETKYPQGGEKQLIKAAIGREVPSGGLPFQAGVVVANVGTCAQIAKSLNTGIPLVERVVTVTGKYLKSPKNLKAKIGTYFKDLIEECGGLTGGEIKKVVSGGPMMGFAVPSLEIPIVKGTSGILVFSDKEVLVQSPVNCTRCARCVDVCPMSLLPDLIADYAEQDKFDKAEKLGAMDCIECGACSYVCGSKRNIVQLIKLAKSEILKKRAKK